MKKTTTDIYHLVDEQFTDGFSTFHKEFMKDLYYSFYKKYCTDNNQKCLSFSKFYCNMHYHKIKLVQICCPYCGHVNLIVSVGKLKAVSHLNYCTQCGKRSATESAYFQLSRFIRMQYVHRQGIQHLKETHSKEDLKLLTFDIYQMELIELTSIIEVFLRDFFISIVFIKYRNSHSEYLNNIIHKSTGNDFMNIEKANTHYKKALGINLRSLIPDECWNKLIDIVQIRNTLIHNNGMIDKKFRNTSTFSRNSDIINGDLIFLTPAHIKAYFNNVSELISIITNLFDNQYQESLHSLVANYYFNSKPFDGNSDNWQNLNTFIPKH